VQDKAESRSFSPDSTHLINCEEFIRHVVPRFVRSTIESELNDGMQPIEERLKAQLPGIVEQALSRAFLEYRTMVDENSHTGPSVDSGYISNPSSAASSRNRKGKQPANSTSAGFSVLSAGYSNIAHESSEEALLSPFIGTAPDSNVESTLGTHQSFASMSSSKRVQSQDLRVNEFLPLEGFHLSNLSFFPEQSEDSISNMMNLDSFNWDAHL
jgi:hypothetical protein